MPYVGRDLQRGNYLKLDDISSSFDGSTTTFNLTSGGNAFFPGSAFSIIVSLGGVIQEPESAFQIDRSQIIFATAPSPNDDFFCIVQGVALGVGVPGHNTVGNDQLAKPLSYGDYFRWDSANNRVGINTLLPSTALDVVGSATFSGNVSIGGTLTYEDVANIDAVGIITARAGIEDKTLTEGHVVFTGTNGRLTGEAQLFYNSTSNKLGIGSDNPQELLSLMANGPCGISLLDSGHGQVATTIKIGNTGKDLSINVPEDVVTTLTNGNYKINTNGSERLRIRGSDGHIGINTTIATKLVTIKADKPFVRLEAEDGSDKRLDFEVTNTGIATISATQSSQQLSFKTTSGEAIRIDSSGLVGIGTNNPAYQLDIVGDGGLSVSALTNSTHGQLSIVGRNSNSGVSAISRLKSYPEGSSNQSHLAVETRNSSNSMVEALRISATQQVGVGTITPKRKVDIVGNSLLVRPTADNISSSGNASAVNNSIIIRMPYGENPASTNHGGARFGIQFTGANNTTDVSSLNFGDDPIKSASIYGVSEDNLGYSRKVGLAFYTSGFDTAQEERARIDSNGDLNLGNNPTNQYGYKLNIQDSAIIYAQTASSGGLEAKWHLDNSAQLMEFGTVTTDDLALVTNNTPKLTIKSGGSVGIGTDNPGQKLHVEGGSIRIRGTGSNETNGQVDFGDDYRILKYTDQNTMTLQSPKSVVINIDNNDNNTDAYFQIKKDTTNPETGGTELFKVQEDGNISIPAGEIQTAQNYPNFRPVLDVNFASIKKLDSRITYQRTGSASFTDELGIIRKVSENSPRFDHDPMSRECKGLLIEEARRNQWLYSEDLFTYVTGGNLQASTLANTTATTDPAGGTNAVLMAATASGGAHSFYKNFTSGSNGDVHTFSIWVKAAGVDYARIYVDTVGGNMNGPGVTFSTKNVWNVSATGVATQVESSAVEYPNGWWRLSVSGSFSNRNDYYCHVDLEGGEADIGFTGNGSDGMYVWGAQFEAGRFVTSYIPTYGTGRDRGADIVRIMDDDFTDIFGTQFENFSVVADFDNSDSLDGNNASILEWWSDNNNYNDRIQIMKDNSSPYHIETRAFGGSTAMFSNGNLSASSEIASNRLATSWSCDYSTNNAANRRWAFSFSGEEVDVVSDNTGTNVPALTRFGIGCSPYKLDLTRGILLFKRLMVYNQTLSDSQLRTLSAR